MSVKTLLLGLALLLVVIFVVQRDDKSGDPVPIPVVDTETELQLPELSDNDFDWIAARIYQNEAAGQSRYLTFWGQGEDFPSFGIGALRSNIENVRPGYTWSSFPMFR